MIQDTTELERRFAAELRSGVSAEDIILKLHSEGVNILNSMKVVRNVCGISLGEAKRLVTTHPAWAAKVAQGEALHDAAEQIAKSPGPGE